MEPTMVILPENLSDFSSTPARPLKSSSAGSFSPAQPATNAKARISLRFMFSLEGWPPAVQAAYRAALCCWCQQNRGVASRNGSGWRTWWPATASAPALLLQRRARHIGDHRRGQGGRGEGFVDELGLAQLVGDLLIELPHDDADLGIHAPRIERH